ncbi:hypothetical protein [Bradyrhizobium sp. STM 3557]|uniref:hypothetical protein n=1 Tax=Bradyrhizobium sp. STM 3557 TaxID=578920 RepID=UPI00388EAD4D
MERFVEEADCGPWTLLPECLDDCLDEGDPVRMIDGFVDALDLAEMNVQGGEPGDLGGHRTILVLLKLYGYLNLVQSSRRLERKAGRTAIVGMKAVEMVALSAHANC